MDSHNESTGLTPGGSRSLSWISFFSQNRGALLPQHKTSFSMRPPVNNDIRSMRGSIPLLLGVTLVSVQGGCGLCPTRLRGKAEHDRWPIIPLGLCRDKAEAWKRLGHLGTGHQSYRTLEDRYGCKRPRVSGSNLKQERRNHTGREESCDEARTDTDEGYPGPFAEIVRPALNGLADLVTVSGSIKKRPQGSTRQVCLREDLRVSVSFLPQKTFDPRPALW